MAELLIKELNEKTIHDPALLVREAEDIYHSRVNKIAEYITTHGKIRIILLAGPSGSGKTTTANLIKDAIKERGEGAIVVSLDDYYRDANDEGYPKLPDGKNDLECPEALRLSEIASTLEKIANGESFILPKYDFKVGARVAETIHAPMPDGCVIIEGLHALNPKISGRLQRDCVLKLFVSVSTNINDDKGRIISGRKIRFIRRMVRDSIYRSATAERTLSLWHSVLSAEDIYLYPYKATADMAFDTFHEFELGVMREYCEKLITKSLALKEPYAKIVLDAVSRVVKIDEKLIPENSLIKEFIPGGIYESIY